MFLTLPPPPTLAGNDPSVIVIRIDLVWSRMIYISLTGVIAFLRLSTSMPIFSLSYAQVLSISSTSSMFSWQEYGPNFSQMSLLISIPNLSLKYPKEFWNVSTYEVGVPLYNQAILSRPIPVSMILIFNSSLDPSWKVLYYMNTMLPTSNPLTKYSIEGPRFPPPAQTSSMNVISSGSIPSSSVSHL
jgi:hypothetical protein